MGNQITTEQLKNIIIAHDDNAQTRLDSLCPLVHQIQLLSSELITNWIIDKNRSATQVDSRRPTKTVSYTDLSRYS